MKLETRVGLFILAAVGIFFYLSINIRALRFDKDNFFIYRAYFDDISGLNVKAPVKIAGVEVGWVEDIKLLEDGKAELVMRISKTIRLAKNAHAMVHQDGLIGTKNLEIDPGDPSTGMMMPGSVLAMPGRTPASVGELLDQFRDIASNIQDIVSSFKNTVASRSGEENIKLTLESVAQASTRLANFAEVLNRTVTKNEENLHVVFADMRETLSQLKYTIPAAKDNLNRVGEASDRISEAAVQGRETLREAGEVVEKVNTGKGLIGKLVNEDETYYDLKKTIRGFKDYLNKTQSLSLSIDMHSEKMLRHNNSKGYFELRFRPGSDYFYQVQLVADENGSITRDTEFKTYFDDKGNQLKPSELNIPLEYKVELAERTELVRQRKNDVLFGLQFGKRFDRLAFRIGLFENSFGAAVDYYVPLQIDYFHWITTVEAFDFRGQKRLNDTRPHIKWINKAFFMNNLYTTFGLDDIFSKKGANPFFGAGLRFNDDDLKYFLTSFSAVKKP